MSSADDHVDLIRLRARYLQRQELTLKNSNDAYRSAINSLTVSLAVYELDDLSPDQESGAVVREIRKLAKRRAMLETKGKAEAKTLGERVTKARGRLDEAIFTTTGQMTLFPALEEEREEAAEATKPGPMRIDNLGKAVPLIEEDGPKAPRPRGRRGRAAPANGPEVVS